MNRDATDFVDIEGTTAFMIPLLLIFKQIIINKIANMWRMHDLDTRLPRFDMRFL